LYLRSVSVQLIRLPIQTPSIVTHTRDNTKNKERNNWRKAQRERKEKEIGREWKPRRKKMDEEREAMKKVSK
jgi:hypothetical protein